MGVDIKYRTPAETEAMHAEFIDGLRAGYRRSFKSAVRQYRTLTGVPHPMEDILSIDPEEAETDPDSTPFELTVVGTEFFPGDTILWGGQAVTTAFVNKTTLTADVPAEVDEGVVEVQVSRPPYVSNALACTFTDPEPPPLEAKKKK